MASHFQQIKTTNAIVPIVLSKYPIFADFSLGEIAGEMVTLTFQGQTQAVKRILVASIKYVTFSFACNRKSIFITSVGSYTCMKLKVSVHLHSVQSLKAVDITL